MGDSAWQHQEFFKHHGVIVHSANFPLYGDMSARVMQTLTQHAQDIEVYSVDEAFLFFAPYDKQAFPTPTDYARYLKKLVYQYTGIPISIGIGPTKTLAKIAIEFAKKSPESQGVFDITDHEQADELLAKIAIEDVWGVGHQYAQKLRAKAINTAYDLKRASDVWVKKNMTINGLKTLHELRGISCIPLGTSQPEKQSITVSRLFGKPVTQLHYLHEALATYVQTAAEKLRAQKSCAQQLYIFSLTTRYHEVQRTYRAATITLPHATAHTPLFISAAYECFKQMYMPGNIYKKVGIILLDIVPESAVQIPLYEPLQQDEKQTQLMKIMDKTNQKWGKNTLSFAASGTKRPWKMRQQKKSDCFTTNWHELLTITS